MTLPQERRHLLKWAIAYNVLSVLFLFAALLYAVNDEWARGTYFLVFTLLADRSAERKEREAADSVVGRVTR